MKIEKYKYLGNNKYKIYIEEQEIIIYEDIIIKNNILSKKSISKEELENYLKQNLELENYYKTLKYISIRLRGKNEIIKYLRKNNVTETEIKNIVSRLEKEKYINDELYCRNYVLDTKKLKNDGPLKIINDLKKLEIKDEYIYNEILNFTKEEQQEKIKKYIEKQVKTNKNKSLVMLKNKLLNNLLLMGYYKEDILIYINEIKVDEEDLYKKEYNKIYNKLCKKYSGKELELKVKQKMYQKGFYN